MQHGLYHKNNNMHILYCASSQNIYCLNIVPLNRLRSLNAFGQGLLDYITAFSHVLSDY